MRSTASVKVNRFCFFVMGLYLLSEARIAGGYESPVEKLWRFRGGQGNPLDERVA
jgi:hypothetical protein